MYPEKWYFKNEGKRFRQKKQNSTTKINKKNKKDKTIKQPPTDLYKWSFLKILWIKENEVSVQEAIEAKKSAHIGKYETVLV